jgi:hypothetical protein
MAENIFVQPPTCHGFVPQNYLPQKMLILANFQGVIV